MLAATNSPSGRFIPSKPLTLAQAWVKVYNADQLRRAARAEESEILRLSSQEELNAEQERRLRVVRANRHNAELALHTALAFFHGRETLRSIGILDVWHRSVVVSFDSETNMVEVAYGNSSDPASPKHSKEDRDGLCAISNTGEIRRISFPAPPVIVESYL